jgi:hypothetical protein
MLCFTHLTLVRTAQNPRLTVVCCFLLLAPAAPAVTVPAAAAAPAAAPAAASEARFVAEDPATFKGYKTDYDRSRSTLTRTGREGLCVIHWQDWAGLHRGGGRDVVGHGGAEGFCLGGGKEALANPEP